jgi:hypothetical protein
MIRCAFTVLFLFPLGAQDFPAAVDLPHVPQPTPPIPPPIPTGTPTKLPADVLYVMTSAKSFMVFPGVDGLVQVQHISGPVVIYGRFVDAPEKVQAKTFSAEYVVLVTAVGSGTTKLIVVADGVKKESEALQPIIEASALPRPPPGPTPVPPGPLPDGALGLTKASREGAAKVAITARQAENARLAKAQHDLAKDLTDGKYKAQEAQGKASLATAVLNARRAANKAACTEALWQPWAASCDPLLQTVYNAGKLATAADWAAAMTEIGVGLEQVP